MTRVTHRAWLVVGAALLLVPPHPSLASSERVEVTTGGGTISGLRQTTPQGRQFYAFYGIPYAKPPVGPLRLRDPVASEGWEGVRDGSVLPPLCSQIPFLDLVKRNLVHEGSEDCLYLNVFTARPGPVEGRSEGLPVMVFIHGGGFFAGTSMMYSGHVLLDQPLVYVAIQYRLGVLGFLSTEDSIIPGNFGLKDQTMALRWVHQNIHFFGGDPTRVTLFGESAGGASVHFHYLSPHSEGLFARGILQSGTLLSPWAMGAKFREVARYTGQLFHCPEEAGASSGEASQALLDCLQEVPAENLTLSLAPHISFNYNPALVGPRVDGDYLPARPEVLMVQGRHKRAPLISGVNSHEGALFASPLYSYPHMREALLANFAEVGPDSLDLEEGDEDPPQLARAVFDHYVGGVTVREEDADPLCQLYGDRHFNLGHEWVSRLHAGSGHDTFLYTLTHRGAHSFTGFFNTTVGSHWVAHVDEIFYLFTGRLWKSLEREEDLRLRRIITQMWFNFAATGNPTPDDSLGFTWEPTHPQHLHHLNLCPRPTMAPDTRRHVRQFWESLPTVQNHLLHPDSVVHFDSAAPQPRPRKSGHRDPPGHQQQQQQQQPAQGHHGEL